MKKILGLDLGTNSIGWAVVNADEITRENFFETEWNKFGWKSHYPDGRKYIERF